MGLIRHSGEDAFLEAVLSLQTIEECRAFFDDVCTIKELQSMAQRFQVACLLSAGNNYVEVRDATGASSATISRVNKCLTCGSGYRTALEHMKKEGKIQNDGCDFKE